MGLFEKAGRQFERIKQQASEAAKEGAQYQCASCGERLFTDAEECPECGAEAVEPTEPPESSESVQDESETESDESADGE